MKQLMIIFSFALILSLANTQEIYSQTEQEKDTIENRIRNRYIDAVDAASSNNFINYRDFLTDDATATSDGGDVLTDEREVDFICKPALKYYKESSIQVVENRISFLDTIQSIVIITIHTDTSKGIAVDNSTPVPKHMKIVLKWEWIANEKVWKISHIDRVLARSTPPWH